MTQVWLGFRVRQTNITKVYIVVAGEKILNYEKRGKNLKVKQ